MKKIFACLLIMMLCACAETSYQYEKQEVLPTIELNMRLIENDQNVVSTLKEDTFNEEELLLLIEEMEQERIAEEEAKRKEEEKKKQAIKAVQKNSFTIVLPSTNGTYQEKILQLDNAQRVANKKEGNLVLDDTLSLAAMARAKELVTKFSHYRPDGSYCTSILSEYGLNGVQSVEIIAWGYRTEEEVMKVWMNSTRHRNVILDANKLGLKKVGIAKYTENGTNYWVQIFTK